MTIEAKVICDSIGEYSPRLTTFWTRYPRFVHDEHLRHRAMSFSVSSSRAIPVAKKLEEVRSDELRAWPVFWGAEQKGMSPGGELLGFDAPGWMQGCHNYTGHYVGYPTSQKWAAQDAWKKAANNAADIAEYMVKIGVHKSIINRLLDPFCHCNVLCTSAEPGLLNFFGLRLDEAAEPTIRALAEAMWAAWCESTPRKLEPGQWHLPFIEEFELEKFDEVHQRTVAGQKAHLAPAKLLRVSTARCARLSYTSFETGRRSTVEEDLALYERLVGAHPIHASPAEHQATPDSRVIDIVGCGWNQNDMPWQKGHLHGNLPGWVQHRKLLPGEAVAPLPEGYAR